MHSPGSIAPSERFEVGNNFPAILYVDGCRQRRLPPAGDAPWPVFVKHRRPYFRSAVLPQVDRTTAVGFWPS